MKNEAVQAERRRRTIASAVTVIMLLALVSLLLEWVSGSGVKDIVSSFAVFVVILVFAAVRFSARIADRRTGEKLWITAGWTRVIGFVARLLPGRAAAPPADPAPTAQPSAPRTLTLDRATGEGKGVRRAS
jgi:hypothetical protein